VNTKRTITWFLGLAAAQLLSGTLLFSCPKKLVHCVDTSADVSTQRFSVKIYKHFLVVMEGQIGGDQIGGELPRQNFVLDTGTAPSIINEAVVHRLGLQTSAASLTAVGRTIVTRSAVIPQLQLGPIRAEALPVQVKNLAQLEHDLAIPVAGIIGMDVLSKNNFRLDYDKREIEFGTPTDEGIPVRFDARSGIAIADVLLEGRKIRMLVDTGSDQVLVLGGNLAGPLQFALRNTAQHGSTVAENAMPVQEFAARDIELAGRHFTRAKAYFLAGGTDPAFDGLLGVRALGFRGISFNQAQSTLYLQK
jgi:predicted aspartyl protease